MSFWGGALAPTPESGSGCASLTRMTKYMVKVMYVYIMGNSRPTLYTGVTNDLVKRVWQHKEELADGFTKKYHLHKLLYYEIVEGQLQAIIREKQIKDMNRNDKLNMIKHFNSDFNDLYGKILDKPE